MVIHGTICADSSQIDIREGTFLRCDPHTSVYIRGYCQRSEQFVNGYCEDVHAHNRYKRQGVTGSGRVGDFCSFNTDCLAVSGVDF